MELWSGDSSGEQGCDVMPGRKARGGDSSGGTAAGGGGRDGAGFLLTLPYPPHTPVPLAFDHSSLVGFRLPSLTLDTWQYGE